MSNAHGPDVGGGESVEHELKFELTKSMLAEFEQREGAGLSSEPRRVWSCYYDTSAGDLMNAGIALRVRAVDGQYLQTVKAATGRGDDNAPRDATGSAEAGGTDHSDAFSRFEWERPIDSSTPSAEALPPPDHPVGARVRECLAMLLPVFETDFERRTRQVLPHAIGRVEIACDRGVIRAGQAEDPIAEVEIERKEGSPAVFYHYALQWARLHDACLRLPSKHERGLRLAGWRTDTPAAVKTTPCAPAGATPVARAARMVLHGHLAHFIANLPVVLQTERAEGPHQMRVALRRLRAAVRFFGLREDPLDDADAPWRAIDRMARSIANAAGFVRDADVFESQLLGKLERSFPRDAALQVLARSLADERQRQRTQLRDLLNAPSTTEFILLTLAAIESVDPGRFDAPDYRSFAARRIAGLVRKVRRRAGIATSESDWHETRIAIKNLRYALDGCAALDLTRETAPRVLSRLGAWQDLLGEGQDLAVARSTASQALARAAAPIEMSVRCVALIDGYRTFVLTHADTRRLGERIRSQLRAMFTDEVLSAPERKPVQAARPAVAPKRGSAVKSSAQTPRDRKPAAKQAPVRTRAARTPASNETTVAARAPSNRHKPPVKSRSSHRGAKRSAPAASPAAEPEPPGVIADARNKTGAAIATAAAQAAEAVNDAMANGGSAARPERLGDNDSTHAVDPRQLPEKRRRNAAAVPKSGRRKNS